VVVAVVVVSVTSQDASPTELKEKRIIIDSIMSIIPKGLDKWELR